MLAFGASATGLNRAPIIPMVEKDTATSLLPLSRIDIRDEEGGPVSSAVQDKIARGVELLSSQFLEMVPTPILVLDELERIVVANRAACSLLLESRARLLGYSAGRFLSSHKLHAARLALRSGETAVDFRDELQVGGVTRDIEVCADVLSDGGESFLCLSIHDRTDDERERVEWSGVKPEKSEHPRESLEHAHRLEALGQLTGALAHDFNNLLAIIQGSLQGAAKRLSLGEDPGADIDRALHATERSIQSTYQILSYVRNRRVESKLTVVGDVLFGLRGLLERSLGSEIELEIEVEETSPIVVVPVQLEMAILNLVVNANDAIQGEGKISISVRARELSADQALSLGLVGGRYLALGVTDTGAGMSPEVRTKVFEPFYTTKGAGRGTGLGLSSVQEFCTRLGGAVTVRSTLGEGTEIELLFPVP